MSYHNFQQGHMILLQILLVVICKAEWKLIYDKFDEPNIDSSNTGWDFRDSCTGGSSSCSSKTIGCTENDNRMLRLYDNCKRIERDFNNLTPHFRLKFIHDIYILGASFSSYRLYFYADNNQIYSYQYDNNDAIYDGRKMCRDDSDTDRDFQYQTRVETFNHDGSSVNLKFCTTISNNDYHIGIRNMQLYQDSCDAKCKQCSSESYCTDCYYGTASGGNCSDCPNNTLFIDITKSSCQQECDSNKVPDQYNICQTDPNISQYDKYFDSNSFTSYGDWEFIADPVFNSLLSKDRILSCSSKSYVGPYGANEAMQLKLTLLNTVQYIRFRVTFFLQDWADDTSIQILWNDIPIDLIYQSSSIIYSQASTIILSDTFGCDKRVRIEKLFTNTQINSKLTFKGNMQVELNQLWGFRDVYIDYGVCEKNCDLCASATKCQTCSGSRKNHKGKCLDSCPLYSAQSGSVCNDFDDDLEYSKYYIKAFYDTSTTDIEASTVMGTFSTIGSNNLKSGGVVFSYLPYKRVFGGSFVWYNARVYRNITNIKPHYQYKLKMEIILGEEAGNFYYNFTGSSNNQIVETGGGGWWGTQSLPPPANHSNLWGQSNDEYQYSIDQIIPHSSNYLNFEMRYDCQQNNPQDGFAAISNFYLIFYYCVPMCPACTGPNFGDCTWGSTYDSTTMQQTTPGGPITCKDHYYLFTDELAVTYTCLQCATNCDVCTSATQCTTCFTDFYLMNGLCECMGGTYLSSATTCSDCNSLCLTCSGPNTDNCLSCHEIQFRMLNKNECICTLYYSLSIDGTCQPICGDMVVMPGEECDDGNLVQFDGCHQCKFQCQLNCQTCLLGKCANCSSGFYLNSQTNLCQSKCGNSIVSGVEECEDGNLLPYDGCYQCQFQCQNECLDCQKGICLACLTGWKINQFNYFCEPYCGDGITVGSEECDDGNKEPFDGCHNCKYSCQNQCSHCPQGQCLHCVNGYQLDNISNLCISICGDLQITETEQCEDGNLLPFDGCYQCEFQCQNECLDCQKGICNACQTGWELNQFNFSCESSEECYDSNLQPSDSCHNFKYSCPNQCSYCLQGSCLNCVNGYQLDNISNLCISICGDLQITETEQCEDGNVLPFDGCYLCEFQCQNECLDCHKGICNTCITGWLLNEFIRKCVFADGKEIKNFEFNNDNSELRELVNGGGKQSCQDGCQFCSIGGCLKCEDGWVLNEVDFSCFTICGDGVVGGLELCDDGNNDMLLNGCLECIYECQLESLVCETSNCYLATNQVVAAHSCSIFQSCDSTTGIYLDQFENTCNSHCGDSIIALEEQCDDGNAIPYDGCDNCLFSCDFLCQDCLLGICVKCQTGYQVIEKKCKGVCGDGIILPELEECDDSNSIPRDGCTACKIDPNHGCSLTESGVSLCYSCPKNCQFCDQLECKQCKSSYFMNQGLCVKCSNKCEECEGNPNNCISCMFEECNLCESKAGYYSNLEEKSCYSKCGDNVVSKGEQCDDGNNVSNDGCNSQCQLEGRFQCGDFGCEEIPLPAISLQYRNSTTTNVILFQIEDNFTSGYCEKLTVMIELFQQSEFNISVTEEISKNSCEFVFTFHKTIEKENLIHFKIPPTDGQRRQLSEIKREIIIKPRKQVYYTDSEISQAQSVLQAQEYLNLILKLIGPMTIVLGGFNFFWTILDIFSWINNFYFINVEYPENVRVFFQHLEWGDLFMIPSINIMNSEEDEYYFEAPPKFVEKDVDPLFLNNIQLFVYLVGLSFFAYFLAGRVLILINKIYPVKRKSKILSFYNLENNFTTHRKVKLFNQKRIPIIITRLRQECQSYSNNYRAILMQIMGLVFLDLCLASFLQITNTSTQEYWIVKTNIIIAWVNLILIGYIFYLNYIVSNSHETLLKNKTFISIFGTLYEGINIESSIAKTYAFVNLIRKCLFIFFTVYYYEDPILQTSTCCLACFLNIALLCYQNPFESVQLLIQIGLPDFFIFSIILTTVCLAVDEQIKLFSNENKLIIGWVILSFIGISILIQLYFLMQVFYQNLQDRWHMIKDLICPEQAK